MVAELPDDVVVVDVVVAAAVAAAADDVACLAELVDYVGCLWEPCV